MKTISYWASKHVWQTRFIIILIYIFLNVIGIFTGKLLTDINVVLPESYFISCIILTVALWIGYPTRKQKSQKAYAFSYVRRKFFDFSLGAVTFLMIIYIGNNWKGLAIRSQPVQASRVVPHSKTSLVNNPLIRNFISSIKSMDVSKLTQREKIKLIKNQIKAVKHDKESSKSDKTLLIILSVLIAIGLLFGLGALACNLSCAGSETLAIIVALGGTALIIFFLIRTIKRITHPPGETKSADTK